MRRKDREMSGEFGIEVIDKARYEVISMIDRAQEPYGIPLSKIGQYTTHIISRLFITIAVITFYVFVGTVLDINTSKKYGFLVGSFIGIIGIALYATITANWKYVSIDNYRTWTEI